MNASSVQFIITNGIETYSISMLAVLGVVTAVIVGFFVFREGVRWLKNNQMVGGHWYSREEVRDWID